VLQVGAMVLERTEPGAPLRVDREARREALLEAAAIEFNARGVSRASLSRIAKAKGLTRAAVYYYVHDRDDLVFHAYRKSCEVMGADLARAREAPGDPLAQLAAFVRLALDPDRAPTAILSDLDYLTGEARATIAAAHDRNVATLRGIIRGGVEAGVIRDCDDEIVAQSIIGMIAWTPQSQAWVDGVDAGYRARTVEALVDLLANGQAADRDFRFAPPISISAFFPAAPNPFDRAAVADAKLEHLLMTASQVFNRRGVDGASLDDIVGAMGATKGALYHYLDNKAELVVRCHDRAATLYERIVEAADGHGRTGLEKGAVGLYLLVQAQASGLSPLTQMVGHESLPADFRQALRRRNRALQRRYEGFGELGLADGSFRSMDFNAVSQLGAGAFEWLPKWFDTHDPRALTILADEIVRLITTGLRRR
jgi:AcrR family transcriptional regulator